MRNWIQLFKSTALAAFATCFGLAPLSAQLDPLYVEPDMNEVVTDFKLVGVNMEGVLDNLAMLTGRAILRPQSLPTPEITFDPGGPITRGELIMAIESLLSLNGIGVSPLGERFLKVVPLSGISREAPELVTEALDDRNPSGKVVSKLFRLQYLDSQAFQQQIQPFLSQGFSSIIPFQNSNAVIVTDTVSNLQRLEYVVSQVDKPSRLNIETVFFTLQYAQASEVADQIQRMIDDARNRFGESNESGNDRSGGNRNNRNGNQPPEPGATPNVEGAVSMQVLFGSNTAISSDDRTNQLIIMTEPGNLSFFEDMIEKLDIQADPSTRIDVIPLKHADAAEVASLLSQFVSGNTSSDGSDRSTADSNNNRNRQPRNTFRDEVAAPNVNANAAPINNANRATQAGANGEERDSQFSSFMTIVADERSNSLVISGTRGDLELMGALINNIDTLLPQVRIEVIIAEVTLGKDITRGMDAFDLSYQLDPDTGDSLISTTGVNFLGIQASGAVARTDGSYELLTLDTIFQRARETSDVNLLSNPNISTTHNKEATIIVGEAQPLITGTTQSTTIGSRSTVQYRDVGIELTVTPLIGPNDVVQMEIDQKIDDILRTVSIDGNEQPIIGRRQATSYVAVKNGEVVVLGGLQKQRNADRRSKVAILGDIPLLGGLFKSTSKEVEKTELMVFLRPVVIRTTDEVNQDARDKIDSMHLSDKIERFLETGTVITKPFDGFEEKGDAEAKQEVKRKGPKG